eukprot:Gb_13275 [translate_table: standard]
MAVASRGTSTLNPNAPLFIPLAYQQIEDFSPEWWKLVQSSPWFRDYWLRERYESFEDAECLEDLFPETLEDPEDPDEFTELEMQLEEALLQAGMESQVELHSGFNLTQHATDAIEKETELVLLKSLNERPCKTKFEGKCIEKPPQIVNVKTSPRRIQQPR